MTNKTSSFPGRVLRKQKPFGSGARTAAQAFEEGNTNHNQGKLDQGIADYSRAIELAPGWATAYYNCGTAHREKSNLWVENMRSAHLGLLIDESAGITSAVPA